jgi:hypothetical protein
MAIKPPSWAKNSIPTLKGWAHPRTGEILVSGSITQKNIDEYFGNVSEETLPPVREIEIEESGMTFDVEDDESDWEIEEIDLDSMTKAQLIKTAEEWEIDIDPKGTKAEIKTILEKELY